MHSHHTIALKSMMYTSLTLAPRFGCLPPNITARCWFTAVNVKLEHGGGLGPVVGGEDHLPAKGEAVQTNFTLIPRWQPTVFFLLLREYLVTQFEITTDKIGCIFIV